MKLICRLRCAAFPRAISNCESVCVCCVCRYFLQLNNIQNSYFRTVFWMPLSSLQTTELINTIRTVFLSFQFQASSNAYATFSPQLPTAFYQNLQKDKLNHRKWFRHNWAAIKNVFLITDTIFLLTFISCWSLHFLDGRVYRQLNLIFGNSLFFSDNAAVAVVKYNNELVKEHPQGKRNKQQQQQKQNSTLVPSRGLCQIYA